MALGFKSIGIPLVLLILQTSFSEARRVAPASVLETVTKSISSIHQNRTSGSSATAEVKWRRVDGRLVRLSDMTQWTTVAMTEYDAYQSQGVVGNGPKRRQKRSARAFYDTRTGERTIDKPSEVPLEEDFPPGLEWKVRQVANIQLHDDADVADKKALATSSTIMQQLALLRPALQCGSSLLQKNYTHTGMGALPGQMLSIGRGAYLHWGIYIGDCNVIQVEAPSNGGIHGDSLISQVTVEQFAAGDELCIQDVHDTDLDSSSLEASVRRAKAALGKTIKYDLFANNCQHFAYETRTGKHLKLVSRVLNHNFNFVANALSGITQGLFHVFNGTQKLWSLHGWGGTPV